MNEFFDATLFNETTDRSAAVGDTGNNQSEEDKKLFQKLIDIEATTDKEYKTLTINWPKYESMLYGNQWLVNTQNLTEYSSDNRPIYTINITNDLSNADMPKRTRNYIFPLLETELALLNELNPMPRCSTFNYDNKDIIYKRNLFLNEVFGKKTPKEYLKTCKEVMTYGDGFFKIQVTPVDPESGENPFEIVSERTKDIKCDPLADSWEEVRWVIMTMKKYMYEVKAKYPDVKSSAGDYETITLKEYWIKDGKVWNQYVVCNGQILKRNEGDSAYPVNMFELARFYSRERGWHGWSEVLLLMEEQIVINKRISQEDWYISMLSDPPTEVATSNLAEGEVRKLPLRPGQHYSVRSAIHQTFRPVVSQPINPGMFAGSGAEAKGAAEDNVGVQKAAMGGNQTGVYTGAHFSKVMESIYVRVKLKEFWIKEAIRNLAIKSFILAEKWTRGGRKIIVWDDNNNEEVVLTNEDFRNIDPRTVTVDTADATLMDPSERIDKLIEMKQYMPNLDDRFFMRSVECVRPGFFDQHYMRIVNDSIAFEEKAKRLQQELQIKQLIAQNTQLDATLQQMQQPPAGPQPGPGGPMGPQPPVQEGPETDTAMQQSEPAGQVSPDTAPPPQGQELPAPGPASEFLSSGQPEAEEAPPVEASEGETGEIDWNEVIDNATVTLAQAKGISEEEAKEIIIKMLEAIEEKMSVASDVEKAAEFVKQMQLILR